MQANDAACNITWPQAKKGNFDFIRKDLAIIWTLLISDSAKPFWVCVWATGCSTSIPIDVQ